MRKRVTYTEMKETLAYYIQYCTVQYQVKTLLYTVTYVMRGEPVLYE